MIALFISMFICGITHADTCYDPNYNRYYECQGDNYIAPIVAALLIGALLANDNDDDGRHHYHHRNDYNDSYRGRGHRDNRDHGHHRGHH